MRRARYIALDARVLAVAVESESGEWAAYIGAVLGHKHSEEWQDVASNGSKLPQRVAEILFPDFAHLRWRD